MHVMLLIIKTDQAPTVHQEASDISLTLIYLISLIPPQDMVKVMVIKLSALFLEFCMTTNWPVLQSPSLFTTTVEGKNILV